MMRALWQRLANLLHRTPTPPPAPYDPDRDPDVRALRLQRRQSERATRHLRKGMNPVERTITGRRPERGTR